MVPVILVANMETSEEQYIILSKIIKQMIFRTLSNLEQIFL